MISMTLRTAVAQIGLGNTDAEIVAALGATAELSRDTTAYTWSGVGERLTEMGLPVELIAGADQIVAAIPGGTMLDKMLTSGGVNFASDSVRGQISQVLNMVSGPAAALLSALLAIGITEAPRWQVLGLEGLPTEPEVAAARVAVAAEQWWAQIANEVVPPLLTAGSDVVAIKAAIQGA